MYSTPVFISRSFRDLSGLSGDRCDKTLFPYSASFRARTAALRRCASRRRCTRQLRRKEAKDAIITRPRGERDLCGRDFIAIDIKPFTGEDSTRPINRVSPRKIACARRILSLKPAVALTIEPAATRAIGQPGFRVFHRDQRLLLGARGFIPGVTHDALSLPGMRVRHRRNQQGGRKRSELARSDFHEASSRVSAKPTSPAVPGLAILISACFLHE